MGFWDTVGDLTSDAIPNVGPAITSVIDFARTIDDGRVGDEGKKSIGSILKGNYADTGERYGTMLDQTDTAYRYFGRGLSTGAQVAPIPFDLLGDSGNGKFWQHQAWSQAWRNSARISAGQALTFRLSDRLGAKGGVGLDDEADWENLWQYGKVNGKAGEEFNPRFSFISGSSDALLAWFADPLVIAGKGAKVAQTVGKTLKPGDLQAIQAGANLTRRQRSLKTGVDDVVEATRGKTASELLQHKALRESSQGDTLAYLIGRANKETDDAVRDEKVRDILAVGFGDPVAKQRLDERDAALGLDLDNLLRDLDDAVLGGAGRASTDDVAAIKKEIATRQSYRFEMDRLHSVSGSLGNEIPTIGGIGDARRLDRLLQDGVASRPVRVMRWTGGYRPQGWVKLEDSRQTLQNVERMLDRVPALSAEKRVAWLDDVINAQTPATRSEAILHLEQRVFRHMAARHLGDRPDFERVAQRMIAKYHGDRDTILQTWAKRRYTGATRPANADEADAGITDDVFVDSHLDDDGHLVAAPILDSQLRNEMPLLNVDAVEKALKRGGERGRTMDLLDEAGNFTAGGLDVYSQAWKMSALMRLGYMIRTVADPQIRMLAVLGGLAYTGTVAAGTKNAIVNRLGKITVEDADDLSRRVQAQMRLDEIGDTTDAALLAEKSEHEATLAQPVKTVTRKRTKAERLHIGVGDTEAAGHTIPGAHGDDYRASLHHIDAREGVQHLLAGSEGQIRKRLRSRFSGPDFDLKSGTDIGYEDAWERVVNRQLRNSVPAKMVLDGKSDAEILSTLRGTADGRKILHDMRIIHGDLDEWVAGVRATVDHVLAGRSELYEIARTRGVTADDLKAVLPNEREWPSVNGGAIAEGIGRGEGGSAWQNIVEKFYTYMNDIPETVLGRHPLYVNLYKRRMESLIRNADEAVEGGLSREQIELFAESSRKWARDEMKRTLFDVSSTRNPGHLLRWVFPFFNAWEDVFQKYGRLVMQDPSRLVHASQIWHAPEKSGVTIDSDGNIVLPGSGVSDGHYVMLSSIPGGGALGRSLKGMAGISDWRISKDSANIVLQGDPVFLPGFGPMVAVPASEIVKRKPDLYNEVSWLLPFGASEKTGSYDMAAPFPRWAMQLKKAFSPDDEDFKQTWTYLHQTEVMRFHNGERETAPTAKEIDKKARNWYIARAFAAGVLPVSVTPQGEMQWYFDEAHRMRADAATNHELYPNGWEQAFYDKYPEYFEATVSLSKNNTGIDATDQGYRATKKWRDLIAEKPEYGWFTVGPEDEGAFSGAVYTYQRTQRTGSGSSDRFRDTKDPKEAITIANARRGWIDYRKVSAQVEAIRIARGLPSLQAAGAEDLAEFKRSYRAYLGQQNPDWQRDYEQIDQGKVRDFLSFAKKVTEDKRSKGRSDLQGMREYLTYREQVRAILAQRDGTLQSNPDVALAWGAITSYLKDRYIEFADVADRMLDNDDLTEGVS